MTDGLMAKPRDTVDGAYSDVIQALTFTEAIKQSSYKVAF